jgi:peroxiredoxin
MDILIIDSESLTDPLWINTLPQLHVSIEFEPNSEASKYHHVYYIKMGNDDVIKALQKQLKHGWYAFRIQSDRYTILFHDASFDIPQVENNPTESYVSAQNHGRTQGIQKEYLNFDTFIHRYREHIQAFMSSSVL